MFVENRPLLIAAEKSGKLLLYSVPAFFADPETPQRAILPFSPIRLRLNRELDGPTATLTLVAAKPSRTHTRDCIRGHVGNSLTFVKPALPKVT
jgi:hypothetical protein